MGLILSEKESDKSVLKRAISLKVRGVFFQILFGLGLAEGTWTPYVTVCHN
jgi:hypothetical protein